MNTEVTLEVHCANSAETEDLAKKLSKFLKVGDVVELVADLGGGKTTFVKGLAKGLGCNESVTSPSFTITNQYSCADGITLYHYDFYRLNDPGLIKQSLKETLDLPGSVNVIEWPQTIKDILPNKSYSVEIKFVRNNELARLVNITSSEQTIATLRKQL